MILGASYGILPGTKLALAGHCVTLVGRPDEIAVIAAEGTELRVLARETGAVLRLRLTVAAESAPGRLALRSPDTASPEDCDLLILAMQEPQYASREVAALMGRIAGAGRPCLSIMNMPPPPFLGRLPGIDVSLFASAYTAGPVWAGFDPALVTLASPDPQAVRPDPARPGLLQVMLATNFKMAPFPDPRHQAVLTRIAQDVDRIRVDHEGLSCTPRVRFIAHDSLYVPLAKWPMLIAGNCRSVAEPRPIPIRDAVWSDLESSRDIFDWVYQLAQTLGASQDDLVDFHRYAQAANDLSLPSSLARALHAGARDVERIDRLIQMIAGSVGADHTGLDAIVRNIDLRIKRNRGNL